MEGSDTKEISKNGKTSVFSSDDEDKSFHYLRKHDIDRLTEHDDSDFVFSVMHHPCSWFNWRISDTLDEALRQNSDLIFDMRENGKKAITTVENVIDYMNLAMRFWITRYNTLQEKVETNMNHLG